MKRWLAWACAGVLVLAVGVRVLAGGRLAKTEPKGGGATATPTPAQGTGAVSADSVPVRPQQAPSRLSPAGERRLMDDHLPPPPPDAPASEQWEYRRILQAIRQGRDPIRETLPTPGDGQARAEEIRKRLAEREEAARKRQEELQEEDRRQTEEQRQQLRQALIEAGIDPDAPQPPLFPPPDLGPAIIPIEKKP